LLASITATLADAPDDMAAKARAATDAANGDAATLVRILDKINARLAINQK
jgi:hypothetical protein